MYYRNTSVSPTKFIVLLSKIDFTDNLFPDC